MKRRKFYRKTINLILRKKFSARESREMNFYSNDFVAFTQFKIYLFYVFIFLLLESHIRVAMCILLISELFFWGGGKGGSFYLVSEL